MQRIDFPGWAARVLLILALAVTSVLLGLDTALTRPELAGVEGREVRSLQVLEDGVLRPYMDRGLLPPVNEHLAAGSASGRVDMRVSIRTSAGVQFEHSIELVEPGYFSSLGIPVRTDWNTLRFRSEGAPREVVVSRRLLQRHAGMQAVEPGDTLWINDASYQIVDVLEGVFAGTSSQPVDLWMPLSAFIAEGLPVGRATRNLPAIVVWDEGTSPSTLEAASLSLRREGVLRDSQSLSAQPLASVGGLQQGVAEEARSLGTLGGFLFAFSWISALAFLALRTLQGSADLAVHRLLGAQVRHIVVDQAGTALKHGAVIGIGACVGSWLLLELMRAHVPGLSGLEIRWAALMAGSWPVWLALWALSVLTLWGLPLLLMLPGLDSRSAQAARQRGLGRLALGLGVAGQASLTGVFVLFAMQSWSTYQNELNFGHGVALEGFSILHVDRESTPGGVVFTSRADRERERREVLDLLSREGRFRAAAVSRFPGAPTRLGSELVALERPGREVDIRSAVPVSASGGFFELAGVPVLAGATFGDAPSEQDAVLGEELARRMFGASASAIGHELQLKASEDSRPVSLRVIGVVGDIYLAGREAGPSPALYRAAMHSSEVNWSFLVEAGHGHDLSGLDNALRNVGSAFRVRQIVSSERNPEIVAGDKATRAWIGAGVVLLLAVLAAVLIGVVAVFVVQRRLHELAIRLSLGEPPTRLGRGLLQRNMAEALVGYVFGLVLVGPLVLRLIGETGAALAPHLVLGAITGAAAAWLVALLPALHRILSLQPAGLLRKA